MPGYRPSAFGAATKVRIGGPDIAISTYSVVMTIVCSESGEAAETSQGVGSRSAFGKNYARAKSKMVGTTGFEPATSRTPSVRATRLRYVPTGVKRRR